MKYTLEQLTAQYTIRFGSPPTWFYHDDRDLRKALVAALANDTPIDLPLIPGAVY